ncbi:hypothetical protein CANARDRAFT_22972 [[Candida] arabinofermentans NRRL YB-2248]|uniref:Uncharacterized protein n=1 Tax=[Candida] arabinofermentans NRRL YB-2248 TaxID=983967 RepID=A0A1E4T109_9ASCO|nr:hypothetical protein CANARDRAFT_22972 [[Candida] arabinofermentans NRRL YB-2248]
MSEYLNTNENVFLDDVEDEDNLLSDKRRCGSVLIITDPSERIDETNNNKIQTNASGSLVIKPPSARTSSSSPSPSSSPSRVSKPVERMGTVPMIGSLIYFRRRRTLSADDHQHDKFDKDQIIGPALLHSRSKSDPLMHGTHLQHAKRDSIALIDDIESETEVVDTDSNFDTSKDVNDVSYILGKYHFDENGDRSPRQAKDRRLSPTDYSPLSSDTRASFFETEAAQQQNYFENSDDVEEDAFNLLDRRIDTQRQKSIYRFDNEIKHNHHNHHHHQLPTDDSQCAQCKSNNENHHHKHHHQHHHKHSNSNSNAGNEQYQYIPGASEPRSAYENEEHQITTDSNQTQNTHSEDGDDSLVRYTGAGDENSHVPGSQQLEGKNRKHQRRLTCAMKFTKPRVVEI